MLSGLPHYYAAPSIERLRPAAPVEEGTYVKQKRGGSQGPGLLPSSVVEVAFCFSVGLSSVEESTVFRRFNELLEFLPEKCVHESLFYRTSEFVIRWLFFLSLLAATEIGFRLGRKFGDRIPDDIKSQISTVEAGILGVLALLLGFTISMAVSRFELRKQLVLEEADAIGTSLSSCTAYPRPGRSPRSRLFFANMSTFVCNTGLREMISHGSQILTGKLRVCRRNSGPKRSLMRNRIQIR